MLGYRLCRNLLVASLCVGLLGSCQAVSPGEINEKYKDVIDKRFEDYQLKDGDTLSVSFYDEEDNDLSQSSVLILHDGSVDMFFLDHVHVEGMTIPEFQESLRSAVRDQTGGRTPEISVQVTPRDEQVMLIGEFVRPGSVPLEQMMTLRDAIARAGGTRISGAPWAATLVRRYTNPRQPDVFTIDLNEGSEEIVLLPGDTVELEKNAAKMFIEILAEYVFGVIPSQLYSGGLVAGGVI